MARTRRGQIRNLLIPIGFLLPNILGMLTFVVFPVVFSIVLAFSDWDLRRHNMFHDERIQFVGLDNFMRLVTEADFLIYLGNTLFLMMAIPFSVGGSLVAALLLSKDTRGGGGRVYLGLIVASLVLTCAMVVVAMGLSGGGMVLLLTALGGMILLLGLFGGQPIYRTLFYLPYFTQGVATFLLWKHLYDPYEGPINNALRPVLEGLESTVATSPPPLVQALMFVLLGLMLLLFGWGLQRLRRMWVDGEVRGNRLILPLVLLCVPLVFALSWSQTASWWWLVGAGALGFLGVQGYLVFSRGRDLDPPSSGDGSGTALMIAIVSLTGQMILLGLAPVFWHLPAMSEAGLSAPYWIHNYDWAKPSLMLMMFWAAIGSNNMLLYLAALTNVPEDLYEAASIDGASRFAKFWHVTWPQLAPTTFFIAVMSTIGGLQGGFEMARVMTEGGPAGATTTLAYFIYIEGFETGRLSFAAAVSWALFVLVFGLTMFNWKFGNQYVNE